MNLKETGVKEKVTDLFVKGFSDKNTSDICVVGQMDIQNAGSVFHVFDSGIGYGNQAVSGLDKIKRVFFYFCGCQGMI